jgi:Double-GTPase 2
MAFGLSKEAPCPYCYAKIDPGKLAYRCSGRPAPGRDACKAKEDPARVRTLADAQAVLPVFMPQERKALGDTRPSCPKCAGLTGTRVCPNCHSVLPDNFTAASPLFGIVGVRGSGKTVLLTVLGKELTEGVARRFDASIDTVGSSSLLTRLESSRRAMESGGALLPDQTAASERVPAVYTLTLKRASVPGLRQTVSTIFSFYDTAGENLKTADRARDLHYLEAANGIILLLDPFGFASNRDEALRRGVDPDSLSDEPRSVLRALTDVLREAEHLKPTKKIKKPVAVVLAKIDAFFDEVGPDSPIRRPGTDEPWFDEAESLELHEYVASLIAKWGGDDLLRALDHNYQTYRFFVASALGAEPDYRKKTVSSRGIQPHRVAEPLLWLMARRSLVSMKKG